MAELPTFSVVVAAHNAARTLPATVRSVLAQTRGDFELVVVDDGSVDGTEAALRSAADDPRIVYLRQDNLGPAAARNAGIDRSRGAFVSMLDSDDLWLPAYLDGVAEAFARDPDAALVYTDAWRLDEETRRIHRRTIMAAQRPPTVPPTDPEALVIALLERNFVYTSATIRRSALDAVGGFRTVTRSEDYELWLRIAASGRHFARTAGVLAVYRDRPGSRIHDREAMLRGRREIYAHVLASYPLSPQSRAVAERQLAAMEAELADLADGENRARSGPVRRFAHRLRIYRLRPPRDVAAAFPDLRRV